MSAPSVHDADAPAVPGSALAARTAPPPPAPPFTWPAPENCRVVFLLDIANAGERRMVESLIARHRPEHCAGATAPEIVTIPSSRRPRKASLHPNLEKALASRDNPVMAPLRVIWRVPERRRFRGARFRDLVFGNPRDPTWLREMWTLWRRPDLCQVIAGEPARLDDLHARWSERTRVSGIAFPEFVAQQAALALERAERRLRGARYKVPRMLGAFILDSPAFRAGAASRLAAAVKPGLANAKPWRKPRSSGRSRRASVSRRHSRS